MSRAADGWVDVPVDQVAAPVDGVPHQRRPGPSSPPRAEPPAVDDSAVVAAAERAVALLALAAAVVRDAADAAVRSRRPVGRVLRHPASAAVQALGAAADRLLPEMARAVLSRLDVPALVQEFVDLDRLVLPLDVDAVVARVDLDAVVDRLDIARVIDRVDLDGVVARVDLDAVVARVDLDGAVDRVDVDRVIARTDLVGLARYVVQEIDLTGLLRASTGSVSSEMVRSVRDQGADADRAVERVVDRLLHRSGRRTVPADGRVPEQQDGGT